MKQPLRGSARRAWNRLSRRRGVHNSARARRRKELRLAALGLKSGYVKTSQPALKRPVRTIECPERMNLSAEYEETLTVIMKIREWAKSAPREPFHIDLKKIAAITPAAALLLAAELDRWNRLNPHRKLKAVDVHLWDPAVRSLLRQMGFFALLGVNENKLNCKFDEIDKNEMRFLPFWVGEDSGGEAAEKLRDKIESFAGRIKDRYALYDGLVEAMTNVSHHAYPGKKGMRRWWISASVDAANGRMSVLCLDHGVGIPKTLPRTNGEELRSYFSSLDGVVKDDARLIQAATKLKRSRTKKRNRGYGLQRDIQRYVSSHDSKASLRIFSNKGMYRFNKDRDGRESVELRSLRTSIGGTFIEWVIEDYARELL